MLNQIGTVTVSTARPLVFDRYEINRGTGSFIVIDPATHFTAGAGMIVNAVREGSADDRRRAGERRRTPGAARAAAPAPTPKPSRPIRKALEEMLT